MPYKNPAVRRMMDRNREAKKRQEAKLLNQSGESTVRPDGNAGDVVADWAESRLIVPTGHFVGNLSGSPAGNADSSLTPLLRESVRPVFLLPAKTGSRD